MILSRDPHRLFRSLVLAVAAVAMVALAGSVGAQTLASVEIEGEGVQVHPTTYKWDGKFEPVLDPGANFYTFYYTGTVEQDGTVLEDVEIKRVAVSNLEWEQNRAAIVAKLQSFIEGGQDQASADQQKSLVNKNVELDGNFNYVDKSKTAPKPNASESTDPISQAEWTFYYDQVVLWQYYCQRVILNEVDPDAKPSKSKGTRERQEYVDALVAYEGDTRGINPNDVLNELAGEDESGDFIAAEYFNAKREAEDQMEIKALHEEFARRASALEDKARRIFDEMVDAIEARQKDREKYEGWVQERNEGLNDFATAWTEVEAGRLLNFDQTYYLLTEEPIEAVPEGARSVQVRKVVTPQDLIEESGKLKPPQYRPGY